MDKLYKSEIVSLFLHFFLFKNFLLLVFSLYKGMLQFSSAPNWETFPAYLIVLDNLRDVFGSSKKTDFMLIMFEVSKVFGC